ncbi:MAG: hypothetical protein ABIG64_08590 [Candidatus Omnitrophota bacterium]
MKKIDNRNLFKRSLDWLFKEEDNSSQNSSEEEIIEINIWQIVIIFILVAGLFLLNIYPKIAKKFFQRHKNSNFSYEYIEENIEKNYFAGNQTIKNGDFSQGLIHWSTSDGGKVFRNSKSKMTLEKNDFHSPPYAMKIESIVPANRYYYTKTENSAVINSAFDFYETEHWLGILPQVNAKLSLWYKGDVPRVSLHCLDKRGKWIGLGSVSGPATDEWTYLEIMKKIPENGRAITFDIVLNQAQGMPLPVIIVDDVFLSVE